MTIFDQPWHGRMNDELNALLLQTPRFDRVCVAVAFAKRSGVSLLRPALDAFVQDGGALEVVAGIDHRGTSRQGLEELLAVTPNVFIFRDNRQNCTFHTKLYLFERTGAEAAAYVGSSNLTAGGLYSNYETNVRYDLDLSAPADATQYQALTQVFQQARQYALPLTSTLMADLGQRGWLGNEDAGFTAIPNTVLGTQSGVVPLPAPSPFPRIPVPTAPRRARPVSRPPRPRRASTPTPQMPAPVSPVPIALPPASTFLMTLQNTDITRGSRSPDVWIPLEARDKNMAFWQWPLRYNRVQRQSGTYDECYFRVNIASPGGVSLEDVRFYHYYEKSEFRINTDKIRSQAQVGDLLQIDRVGAGVGYEYEITIIPQTNPVHAQLLSLCQKVRAGNSQKRFAYV